MTGLHPLVPTTVKWQDAAPEIILEVLKNLLPFSMEVFEPSRFPWYLGHICRPWRAIFVSSPVFWTSVTIDFRIIDKAKSATFFHMHLAILLTEMCIEQSKNYPIDFKLILPHCIEEFFEADDAEQIEVSLAYNEVLDALISVSTRWREVLLDIRCRDMERLYSTKGQLSILNSIELRYRYSDCYNPEKYAEKYADLFEDAPQLARVSLVELDGWKLDLSGLTALYINSETFLSTETLAKHLQQMRQLSELYLLSEIGALDPLNPPQKVSLPSLKVLSCERDLYSLFEALSLEEVYVQHSDYVTPEDLGDDLQSSMHSLRKLVLPSSGPDVINDALKCFPNLRHLELYIEEDLFKMLSNCSAAQQLEILTIDVDLMPHEELLLNISRIGRFWKRSEPGRLTALKQFSLGVSSATLDDVKSETLLSAEKILKDVLDVEVEIFRFERYSERCKPEF